MKNLDRDIIDFGNGNIPQMFAKMLIPTIFGMLFSALFCITDGIFIGHGVGSDGLASVNIVSPIFTLAVAFGMMSGMGSSVIAEFFQTFVLKIHNSLKINHKTFATLVIY